jgi:hypothetical protein
MAFNIQAFYSLSDKCKQSPHDFAIYVYAGVLSSPFYSFELKEGQSYTNVLRSNIIAYFKSEAEEDEDKGRENVFQGADISSVISHLLELVPYMKPTLSGQRNGKLLYTYKMDRSSLPVQSDKLAVDIVIQLNEAMFGSISRTIFTLTVE